MILCCNSVVAFPLCTIRSFEEGAPHNLQLYTIVVDLSLLEKLKNCQFIFLLCELCVVGQFLLEGLEKRQFVHVMQNC